MLGTFLIFSPQKLYDRRKDSVKELRISFFLIREFEIYLE